MAVKFLLSWWTPSIHMRKLWRHYENIVHIMLRLNVSIRVVIHALWKNLYFLCPELWAWRNLMLNGEWSVRHCRDGGRKVSFLPSFLLACLPFFLLSLQYFLLCFISSCSPVILSTCLQTLHSLFWYYQICYCLDYVHALYSFQS